MEEKKRRPNFSASELRSLINGVKKRRHIVEGRLDNNVTPEAKQIAWEQICLEVNQVSQDGRSVNELRRKWTDFKSVAKKKGVAIHKALNKTSGGMFDVLQFEQEEAQVVRILGEPTVSIEEGDYEIDIDSLQNNRVEDENGTNTTEQTNSDIDMVNILLSYSGQGPSGTEGSRKAEKRKNTKESSNNNIAIKLLEGQNKIYNQLEKLVEVQNELLKVEKERLSMEKTLMQYLAQLSGSETESV